MKAQIREMLCAQYGIMADSIEAVRGGWSASAYVARAEACGFFVKQYDRRRVSTRPWIERIDTYMPAVLWLHDHTRLRDRMTAPLPARNHAYKVEDGAFVWMVFPLIEGETLAETPLTSAQARELASILAELHAHGGEIPAATDALRETYDLPFLSGFEALLRGNRCGALRGTLSSYGDVLWRRMDALQKQADALRDSTPRYALCHTDVHGWNLMWAERLVLIDWEGLQLAPVEADLFSFTEGFFFDYAGEAFFEAYREASGGYTVDEAAMAFYRLRRRLEDIAAFADSIAHDGLTPEEIDRSLRYLEKECVAITRE